MERLPWDDLREILHGRQMMAKVQNDEELLPKVSNPGVGCMNVRIDNTERHDRRICVFCDSQYPNVT